MTTETIYKYIKITELIAYNVTGRKTKGWAVDNLKSGDNLGSIGWCGAWRQYVFAASDDCVFSAGCLDDISQFISEQMEARKQ